MDQIRIVAVENRGERRCTISCYLLHFIRSYELLLLECFGSAHMNTVHFPYVDLSETHTIPSLLRNRLKMYVTSRDQNNSQDIVMWG